MWDQVMFIIGALALAGISIILMARLLDFLRGKSGAPLEAPLSPLLRAVMMQDKDEVLRLIEAGADVSQVDPDYRNALHHAVLKDDIEIAKILIQKGVPINAQDGHAYTPVHYAAQDYLPHIVRLLIENGADVSIPDFHGNTPLSTAVFNSRGRGEVIKLLLAAGADPYAKNLHGVSAIDLARTIANYDVRQFFDGL
jgi:ankyrin repeat protein